MMTNSELVRALGRWSHDPALTERGQKALRRAAMAIVTVGVSLEALARAGTLQTLHRVGPFTERVILELLEGTRPAVPVISGWPEPARREYERTAPGYDTYLAMLDARQAVAERRLPPVLGDLQNHTTWSDGRASPRALVRAAQNLGYDYIAVTDHSAGLPIARGMTPERMRRQHAALERMARPLGIRVLRGIETNILPAGELDVGSDDLRDAELVVASCHSLLRRPEDQTARLVAAVRHPQVHILGHPRGRLFGTPRGLRAGWDEVFAAAAEAGTAIEINASVDRQDIDFLLAARAIRAGCWISLGTDSHALEELAWMDIARGHLALAGSTAPLVLNHLRREQLADWLQAKRGRVRRPA